MRAGLHLVAILFCLITACSPSSVFAAPSLVEPAASCNSPTEAREDAAKDLAEGVKLRKLGSPEAQPTLQRALQRFVCLYELGKREEAGRELVGEALQKSRELVGEALQKMGEINGALLNYQEALQAFREALESYGDTEVVKRNRTAIDTSIASVLRQLGEVELVVTDQRDASTAATGQPGKHSIKRYDAKLRGTSLLEFPKHVPQPLILRVEDLTSLTVRACGYEDFLVRRELLPRPTPQTDPNSGLTVPSLYRIRVAMVPLPLKKRWWLWTIVGAGATGLAVGLGVGLRPQPPVFVLE